MAGDSINFNEAWKESDVVLLVEGKQLHCHRLILSLQSEVFNAMFHQDFKEKESKEIPLPGKSHRKIKEMLSVLYDTRNKITEENFDFLLDLSEEYQVAQLHSACVDFITNADKSGVKAIKFIPVLNRYGLKNLEEICLDSLKTTGLDIITDHEDFQKCDDFTKNLITSTRGEYLERLMNEYRKDMDSLLRQLFQAAHHTYIEQLTDKGYEESVLSICERKDQHKLAKQGHCKFDFDCSSCRRRVRTTKEFTVKVKDVIPLMDKLLDKKANG